MSFKIIAKFQKFPGFGFKRFHALFNPSTPVTGLNIEKHCENYFHYRSKGHLHFELETIGKYISHSHVYIRLEYKNKNSQDTEI